MPEITAQKSALEPYPKAAHFYFLGCPDWTVLQTKAHGRGEADLGQLTTFE